MLQLCVHMCEGVETFLRKPQNRAVDTSHALCQNVAKLSGNEKKKRYSIFLSRTKWLKKICKHTKKIKKTTTQLGLLAVNLFVARVSERSVMWLRI